MDGVVMTKVLIVGMLMLGLLVELTLRFVVLLVLTCTIFGLAVLMVESKIDTVMRPMLLPILMSTVEIP